MKSPINIYAWIVAKAAEGLPPELRERMYEEWMADLSAQNTAWERFSFAVDLMRAATSLRHQVRESKKPKKNTNARTYSGPVATFRIVYLVSCDVLRAALEGIYTPMAGMWLFIQLTRSMPHFILRKTRMDESLVQSICGDLHDRYVALVEKQRRHR